MDSNGRIFASGGPGPRSAMLAEYERLSREGFDELEGFSDADLEWLQRIHDRYLDYYREERKLHFGAFALVGLALVILLPAVLTLEEYFLPLAAVEVLLLVLLVPYTFVYRRYEEGVRRKMREAVLLADERRLRTERGADSATR
jgi:hypothetical protein